jgi:hypothetical protein
MSQHTKHQAPSRVVASVVAVFLGTLIGLEPLVIDTKPGLQIAQAVFVIWFWALFMFAGRSDRGSSGK